MKTSIEIPDEVWTAAKIRAVHDRTNLQDVIAAALREYLGIKPKKGGKQ